MARREKAHRSQGETATRPRGSRDSGARARGPLLLRWRSGTRGRRLLDPDDVSRGSCLLGIRKLRASRTGRLSAEQERNNSWGFKVKDLKERLLDKVEVNSEGCWIWVGCGGRYGHITVGGVTTTASRVSFSVYVRPLLKSEEADHTCENKRCINPEHLEAVTHLENMRRARARGEIGTHGPQCKNGHLLDGKRSRDSGGRYCRTCVALSKRRQRAAKRLSG